MILVDLHLQENINLSVVTHLSQMLWIILGGFKKRRPLDAIIISFSDWSSHVVFCNKGPLLVIEIRSA